MHGEELKYMTEAYKTNWMSTVGANINEIERIAAEKTGCKYAVALSAGTAALEYYRQNGNLQVPVYYTAADGIRLGAWIAKLKRIYKGNQFGSAELTDVQIARLNEIGMCWSSKHNNSWEKLYAAVCDYKKKYGNLNIPVAYTTADGFKIGRWIRHKKEKYDTLSPARRKKLDAIGLIKIKSAATRQNYADENLLFGEQI